MKRINQLYIFTVLLIFLYNHISSAQPRDGKIYDQGLQMQQKAQNAPEELDMMSFYIGQWDIMYKTFDKDGNPIIGEGKSLVYFMNRGHAILEKFHSPNFDGKSNELNTISFLAYSKANKQWNMSIANSVTENISVYNGVFKKNELVLTNSIRLGGGILVTHYKAIFKVVSDSQIEFTIQESTDERKTWTTSLVKTYKRRKQTDDYIIANVSNYGTFAPDLPDEARQFDFLIGEWNAFQDIKLANGQNPKFPSNATGVYCLNGHAILEYNWYNIDPSLPDAATTIVRIYNRAMRRWESMFLTNRFNSILYFGGKKEDDRIILYPFEINASNPTLSYFIFHDIQKDQYNWYAENSTDRGKTFTTTWKISMTRTGNMHQ